MPVAQGGLKSLPARPHPVASPTKSGIQHVQRHCSALLAISGVTHPPPPQGLPPNRGIWTTLARPIVGSGRFPFEL